MPTPPPEEAEFCICKLISSPPTNSSILEPEKEKKLKD
jgi:hypothetical protein